MDRFEVFAGSVLELNRYLQKIKDMEMRSFGLRGNHVMSLHYLGRNPAGLTATELTDACKEDKAAISRTITQLIEKGYVYQESDENKRAYRTKLFLTEKGKELVQLLDRRIDFALTRGGKGLTDEQRRVFYTTLDMIIDNLSRYDPDEFTP